MSDHFFVVTGGPGAGKTTVVMRETYTALGYEITELPRTDIVQRANDVATQLVS